MRLIITDSNLIWHKDNPYLKKYKDVITVVCLDGKKITDEYECFVSPYKLFGLGMDKYGIEGHRFKALASVAGKLNAELDYHEDIVFLTDGDPCSLYPYYALKDIVEYNNIHLIAMSPFYFEAKARIMGHRDLMNDLSKIDSLLYYDVNDKLKKCIKEDKNMKMGEFLESITNELGELLPHILNGINRMRSFPCFFDFNSLEYIPLEKGYDSLIKKKIKKSTELDFELMREYCTLGLIMPVSYPKDDEYTKEEVERPVARIDGKRVCNILREQRLKLAEANNIPFESEECPSIGPCAGTCEKCDREATYLRKAMNKISEDKRVYPQFDPIEEVTV